MSDKQKPAREIVKYAAEAEDAIAQAIKMFEEQTGCRVFHITGPTREKSFKINYHV